MTLAERIELTEEYYNNSEWAKILEDEISASNIRFKNMSKYEKDYWCKLAKISLKFFKKK